MMIGIAGLGFVGNALKKSFELKKINVKCYDKYKEDINNINVLFNCNIVFLALPTCFSYKLNEYDKSAIIEVCKNLEENNYNGLVVIKSTIEPETTDKLCNIFKTLKMIHNPEFLSAATAFEDFHNQKHIVIGKSINIKNSEESTLVDFYKKYYPNSLISLCTSLESESMKCFLNCFYSVKIQFFNELYLTCQKNGSDYNKIKDMMIKNEWINPMHTLVPGTDGKLSYGGYCFPKDTNALLQYMKLNNINYKVLEATIHERNIMRNDNVNMNE